VSRCGVDGSIVELDRGAGCAVEGGYGQPLGGSSGELRGGFDARDLSFFLLRGFFASGREPIRIPFVGPGFPPLSSSQRITFRQPLGFLR
jgi:hypothetical protein